MPNSRPKRPLTLSHFWSQSRSQRRKVPRGDLACSLLAIKGAEPLVPDSSALHNCLHGWHLGHSVGWDWVGEVLPCDAPNVCHAVRKNGPRCNPLSLTVFFQRLWDFGKPVFLLAYSRPLGLLGVFFFLSLAILYDRSWQTFFYRGQIVNTSGFRATYNLYGRFFSLWISFLKQPFQKCKKPLLIHKLNKNRLRAGQDPHFHEAGVLPCYPHTALKTICSRLVKIQKTLALFTLPALCLLISKPKEALLVLKIRVANDGELSGTHHNAPWLVFPTPASEFCLFGYRTILYHQAFHCSARKRLQVKNKKNRLQVCVWRHWTPQPSGQLGNWAGTLASVYPSVLGKCYYF